MNIKKLLLLPCVTILLLSCGVSAQDPPALRAEPRVLPTESPAPPTQGVEAPARVVHTTSTANTAPPIVTPSLPKSAKRCTDHYVKHPNNPEYILESSFHSIPSALSDYVGSDKFSEWYNSTQAEDVSDPGISCGRYCNIKNFIRDFQLPREVFERFLTNENAAYQCDYDLDILYGGTDAEIDEYYLNTEARLGKVLRNRFISSLKSVMLEYLRAQTDGGMEKWIADVKANGGLKYSEYCGEFTGAFPQWSVQEAVARFGIARADMETMVETAVKRTPGDCTLDLDLLYSGKLSFTDADSPLALDEALIIEKKL